MPCQETEQHNTATVRMRTLTATSLMRSCDIFCLFSPPEWTDSAGGGRGSLPPRHSWPSEGPRWVQSLRALVQHRPPLSQADPVYVYAAPASRPPTLQLARPCARHDGGEKSRTWRQPTRLYDQWIPLCLPWNYNETSETGVSSTLFFHIAANMPCGCLWICCINHSVDRKQREPSDYW